MPRVFLLLAILLLVPWALASGTTGVYQAPPTLPNANGAADPTVGYNANTGTILFEAGQDTYRVSFGSSPPTWTDASRPDAVTDLHEILLTDSVTGRTWVGSQEGACVLVAFSDDNGGSWTPGGATCVGGDATMASGPHAGGLGATYPRALYVCGGGSPIACARSSDGGQTFGAPSAGASGCSGPVGHAKVSSSGILFVPSGACGNSGLQVGGLVSSNGGLTLGSYLIPSASSPSDGNFFAPAVATTASGWLYEAWQGSDGHLHVALSKSNGTTWINATDLSATLSPAVVTATMPAMIAGADGKAEVAYLGTTASGNAFASSFAGTWDLYVSYTLNGGGTWTTQKVTTDPVQRGWICAAGTSCASHANLGESIDATKDGWGDIVVGFADGCVGACAGPSGTGSTSTSSWATLAIAGPGVD